MRIEIAAACAGALGAAAMLGGTSSSARTVEVSPGDARPGESVTVSTGACAREDVSATVSSPAFDATPVKAGDGGAVGVRLQVKQVQPRDYEVRVVCGPSKLQATGRLTVSPPPYRGGGDDEPHEYPRTGGGGMAGGGGSGPMTAAGLALVAVAAGLGGFTLAQDRRRARRRR